MLSASSLLRKSRHLTIRFTPSLLSFRKGICCICGTADVKVVTLSCGHGICRDDLSAYLRASLLDASMFPLKCPMHHEGCTSTVTPNIAGPLQTKEENRSFQEYHDRAVLGDGMRCINCDHYIVLDVSPETNKIYMTACPRCTHVFCLQCCKSSHNGKRCPVDLLDDTLHQWKEASGAQQCPCCRKIIEKEGAESCNHMVHKASDAIPCCRERTDFCYLCGTEVLAGYPHNEVLCEGLDHFPDGVFQKCRKIIEKERNEERERIRKKARWKKKYLRRGHTATIVPIDHDDSVNNHFDAFFEGAMRPQYPQQDDTTTVDNFYNNQSEWGIEDDIV